MAHDEMLSIRELDVATLDTYRHRIWFYFAENDDWVDQGRETILQAFRADPDTVKVVHGYRDIPHAFCISVFLYLIICVILMLILRSIDHSEELAAECYEWLVSGGFV